MLRVLREQSHRTSASHGPEVQTPGRKAVGKRKPLFAHTQFRHREPSYGGNPPESQVPRGQPCKQAWPARLTLSIPSWVCSVSPATAAPTESPTRGLRPRWDPSEKGKQICLAKSYIYIHISSDPLCPGCHNRWPESFATRHPTQLLPASLTPLLESGAWPAGGMFRLAFGNGCGRPWHPHSTGGRVHSSGLYRASQDT